MTDRIQELMDLCWDPGRGVVNPRKLAYCVVKEAALIAKAYQNQGREWDVDISKIILEHFGVKTRGGVVCPKCGVDRTKESCPSAYNDLLVDQCPMVGESQ